jgi:hypothetical protein
MGGDDGLAAPADADAIAVPAAQTTAIAMTSARRIRRIGFA